VTATEVAAPPQLHAVRGPYQGLMPYTEDRHRFFFGRDRDISLIASNARAYRFCLLYGLSGVGKSSVLQAGVVRSIRDETAVRRAHFDDEPVETVVAYLKDWRDDPLAGLWAAVLAGFRHEGLSVPADTPVPADVSAAIASICDAHDVDLVMILDQFEEFFLYHSALVPDVARLIAQLTAPQTHGNVLISMREDALSRLDEFEGIVPGVFDHTLRIEHLDEASARSAIVDPLRTFNEEVPESERREIEPALVDRLLTEVRAGQVQVDSTQDAAAGAAAAAARTVRGPARIEAPFLQLVLTRLWEEESQRGSRVLRLATLEGLGGAQAIVSQHLDRVMAAFTKSEQAVLTDAFGHLVTPSGSKIAHRPSDLAAFSKQDPAVVTGLLRRLAEGDQRILREVPPPLDEPQAEPRYEIFHDVLALAVLDWRRRRVADAEVHETRRRLRRVTGLAAVMALLLVACLAVGAWALHSRTVAQSARQEAEKNADRAEANNVLDEVNRLLSSDPAAALTRVQDLPLDAEHDADGRYQDAYRRALDAADTDLIIRLGSPAVLADFVTDGFVAVTDDGHVRRWTLADTDPMRLADKPDLDVTLPDADSSGVGSAFSAADGRFVVVRSDTGAVVSVDLSTGEVRTPDAGFATTADDRLSYSSAGSRDDVLLWDFSGHGVVWHVADNTVTTSHAFDEPVVSADIDSGSARIAVARIDPSRTAEVWDTARDQLVDQVALESHIASPQTISYAWPRFTTLDGSQLAIVASGWVTEVSLWDVGSGAPTPLGGDEHWRQVYDVADMYDVAAASSPDGGFDGLIAVAGDKHVELFDTKGEKRGQVRNNTSDFRDWATMVKVNPADTRQFVVVSNEGYADLYEPHLLVPTHRETSFRGHTGPISSVAWSEDGERLATASEDGTVRVWRVPQIEATWYSPDWILAAKQTPDGHYEFGYTPGGYVTRSGSEDEFKSQFVSTYGQLTDMDPAPDGRRAVIIDEFGCLAQQTSFAKQAPTVDLPTPEDAGCPKAVAWSPDPAAHQIVAGDFNGRLWTWDADTGKVTGDVEVGSAAGPVQDLDYSGDGKLIVALTAGAQDAATGTISVMKADDLSVVDSWPASDLDRVAISDDGRFIVTAGNESRVVQVWDTEDVSSPAQVMTSANGAGTLSTVAVSHDDAASWVAVATASGRIYVWDRASGRLLSSVLAHGDAANAVTFDRREDDRLISAGDDGEVVTFTCDLCAMDTGDLRGAAKAREAQVVDVG
jgi:WD40 repeat protein